MSHVDVCHNSVPMYIQRAYKATLEVNILGRLFHYDFLSSWKPDSCEQGRVKKQKQKCCCYCIICKKKEEEVNK